MVFFREKHFLIRVLINRVTAKYCAWTKRFVRFYNLMHPKEMGETEINAFLTRLAVEEKALLRCLLPV